MNQYDEPFQQFLDGIPTATTRAHYKRFLKYFFDFLELGGDSIERNSEIFAEQAKDTKLATSAVMKFIRYQKERIEKGEISANSISNYFKPIKLFCTMNDIILNWDKISKTIPKGKQRSTDRIPTQNELKLLLGYPDRRLKSAILIMMSSGIRLGAWDYLRLGDIEPITKNDKLIAAKVIVYRGEDEEYFTFITPEAYTELQIYVEFRKSHGENINSKSWVLRDEFNTSYKGHPKLPKQLKSLGLKSLVERALYAQGVRKPLTNGKRRHEFKTDHGLRKYFKTMAEKKMKSLHVEILMGHATGLADNYYRISEQELLEEYLKATNDLNLYFTTPTENKVQSLEKDIVGLKNYISKVMLAIGESKYESLELKNTDLKDAFSFSTDSDAIVYRDKDNNETRY